MIVATSLMYATANVYTRRFVSDVHPLLVAFLQISFGALWLTPVVIITESWWLTGQVQPVSVLALLELGILGSALGYVLFFDFIATLGSTATSLSTYLQPVVGIALGVAILGERPDPVAWIGIGVVLTGVAVFGGSSILRNARHRSRLRRAADRSSSTADRHRHRPLRPARPLPPPDDRARSDRREPQAHSHQDGGRPADRLRPRRRR